MPTYGYQCTRCEDAFEVVQKITDAPLATCSQCGGELRKKIFPVGIQFKGSGFYVNDYAKSGGAAKTDSGEAKTDAPAAKAEAGADAKPVAEAKPAETAAAAPSAPESKPSAATPAAS